MNSRHPIAATYYREAGIQLAIREECMKQARYFMRTATGRTADLVKAAALQVRMARHHNHAMVSWLRKVTP